MYAMFYGATSFTSDVSSWDVSHVVRMAWMFSYASVSTAMSDDLLARTRRWISPAQIRQKIKKYLTKIWNFDQKSSQ